MPRSSFSLKTLRSKIDAIDKKITALLKRRAELAQSIGIIKQKSGSCSVFVPKREKAVMSSVLASLPEGSILKPRCLRQIYTQIISACRSLQGEASVYTTGKTPRLMQKVASSYLGAFIRLAYKKDQKSFIDTILESQAYIGIISKDDVSLPESEVAKALKTNTAAIKDAFYQRVNNKKIKFYVVAAGQKTIKKAIQ